MENYQWVLSLAALLALFVPSFIVFRLSSVIAKAVASGVTTHMRARDAESAKERAAEADRLERLQHNPWNKNGDSWNLTQQILTMRDNFDAAIVTAAEAGVNITALRDHVSRIPDVVVLEPRKDSDSRSESTVDGPKSAKRPKAKKRRRAR